MVGGSKTNGVEPRAPSLVFDGFENAAHFADLFCESSLGGGGRWVAGEGRTNNKEKWNTNGVEPRAPSLVFDGF